MGDVDRSKILETRGLIAAKCPRCGGIMSLKRGGDVLCEFCGSKFFLHEAYRGESEEIQNYYELAYNAQESNNPVEAFQYFTKILELNTGENLAWYGKGIAALGKSTGYGLNTEEAIACFNKALEYSPNADRARLKETIAASCLFYANGIYAWLLRYGWIDADNYRNLMELYFYSDLLKPLDVGDMEQVVYIMCNYKYVDYSKRINYYTEKIREENRFYLNPKHTTVVLILAVIASVLIVFVSYAIIGNIK